MDFLSSCAFCNIAAKKLSAKIHFEDDEIIVFENALMGKWAPMMLLLIPRNHMEQKDLWQSNRLWNKLSKIATNVGKKRIESKAVKAIKSAETIKRISQIVISGSFPGLFMICTVAGYLTGNVIK